MKALYLLAGIVGLIGSVLVSYSSNPGAASCAGLAACLSLFMLVAGVVMED